MFDVGRGLVVNNHMEEEKEAQEEEIDRRCSASTNNLPAGAGYSRSLLAQCSSTPLACILRHSSSRAVQHRFRV
jgi:hypothetical protein